MKSLPVQFDLVRSVFPDATMAPAEGSMHLITLPQVELPSGWSQSHSHVKFVVPNGYPYAAPDCFWADMTLRLADGTMPKNAQVGNVMPGQPDTQTLWFSWHVNSAWKPSCDLMTYIKIIRMRFEERQ
jgi:hypothetical protein